MLRHFWLEFQHGTSQGKCSFWAPSAKYQPALYSILGIGEVSDSDLQNLIRASLKDVGAIQLFCLCEKAGSQKLIKVWCSPQKKDTAIVELKGLNLYDWLILDAFLLYSSIDIP